MATPFDSQTFAMLIDRGVLQIGDGHRAKLSELGGDGPIFLRAGLLSDGGIRLRGADRFRKDVVVPSAKFAWARDTFVTTKGNSVGRAGYIPPHLPQLVYSPHLSYWRSQDRGTLHPEFLRYWASSPAFVSQLHAMAHGTDMAPYLSLVDQKRLVIHLPSIDEQRYISRVLGALDDKIDSNRRLAGLLEETSAALFRARFVDFVGVEEFEGSDLGPIPRSWGAQPIGDVLRVVGGSTPSTKQPAFWNGGHCWITPKDLSGAASPIVLDTARHVTDEGVAQISSRLLPKRTVLLSSRAPVGYMAVSFVPIAINQGFIAIPPTDSIPSEFVYFWLRERMDEIKARAGGTTFAEVSKRAFRPLLMLVPPSATLDMFRRVAEPMFDKMASLEAEHRTLAQIRDALLPQLVSGEIRVPDTSDPAEGIEPLVA
jgi:type I restriction enzyme S subunit